MPVSDHSNISENLTSQNLTDLIQKVESVLDAKVTLDEQNFIQEIYVLADKSRGAKQIVRDIETAAAVEFDIELDHRKISVVQLSDKEEFIDKNSENRLILHNLVMEYNGRKCRISVELSDDNNKYHGDSEGPGSEKNQNRLVAQATLKAIECNDGFDSIFSLVLEEVSLFDFAGEKVALVAVSLVRSTSEEFLVGSSLVRKDDKEAVARATLDAVNRRLKYLK